MYTICSPGYAGIVNVGGLRIGGMSGIYEEGNYHKGSSILYMSMFISTCIDIDVDVQLYIQCA